MWIECMQNIKNYKVAQTYMEERSQVCTSILPVYKHNLTPRLRLKQFQRQSDKQIKQHTTVTQAHRGWGDVQLQFP